MFCFTDFSFDEQKIQTDLVDVSKMEEILTDTNETWSETFYFYQSRFTVFIFRDEPLRPWQFRVRFAALDNSATSHSFIPSFACFEFHFPLHVDVIAKSIQTNPEEIDDDDDVMERKVFFLHLLLLCFRTLAHTDTHTERALADCDVVQYLVRAVDDGRDIAKNRDIVFDHENFNTLS